MRAVRSISNDDSDSDNNFVPYVSPETKVRREIKTYRTQVRRLKRQIAAQHKLESLKAQAADLCKELERLRNPTW